MVNCIQMGKSLATFIRGTHKIPRFIYHMTSKVNYESIMSSGSIKPKLVDYMGEGICAADINNLFKRWANPNPRKSILNLLLSQVDKGTGEIVILRIPTSKLNIDALHVRSQKRYLSWMKSPKGKEICEKIGTEAEKIDFSKGNAKESYVAIMKKYLASIPEHIKKGAPAKLAKLYKQRKEPIEYFYSQEINARDIQKIGEFKGYDFCENLSMKEIFTSMLSGTPECKATELLVC